MITRARRSPEQNKRRRWPTPSMLLAGAALFIALGGSAVAAEGLIRTADIAPGAVTSVSLRNGAVEPKDLSARTRKMLLGSDGPIGPKGDPGLSGTGGTNGANGPNGANGIDGDAGENGSDGVDGIDGTNGIAGTNGTNGTNGADGTIAPFSATEGLVELLTATPPTVVIDLPVPAGNYVVLAKTQLSHTGAGDSIECLLKAGDATIDRIAMKTLPALAAIPVSLQAVTVAAGPTLMKLECDVFTAGGSANFSSLIAIPTA